MSDFQIKLKNGQMVNYSDLSKKGIQIEDVSPEYRNIFEAVQKFVNKKLKNENGSDGNNSVLSTAELSIFANAVQNKAKGHNSKNLGKREFNSLMKEFEEAGVSAEELNFDKNKFLGFIKNLFDNRHNYDPKATVVVNQNSQEGVIASLNNAANRPIEVRDPETGKLKQKTILENGIKTVIKYDENEKPISETVTNHAKNTEITYKYVNGKKIPEKEIINKGTEKEEVTNYKLDDSGVTLTATTEKKDGTKITTRYVADDNDNFDITKPSEQIIENNDTIIRTKQSFDEKGKPVTTRIKSKKTENGTERKVLEDVVTSDGRTITEYGDDGKVTRKEEHKYKTLPDGSVEVEQTVVTTFDKNGNATRVTRNAKQEVVSTENLLSKKNKAKADAEAKRAAREAAINAKLTKLGVDVNNKGKDAGKSIDIKIPSTETNFPNLINGWKRKRQYNQYSQDVTSNDWKKCKTENRVEIDCSKYKNVKELAKDLFWMEGFDPDNSPAWQARIKERAAKICKDWLVKTADGKLNIGGKINGKRYLDMAANRPEIRYVQEYAPDVKGTVLGDVKGTKYQVVQGTDGQLYYIDKNTKKSVDPKRVKAKIVHTQSGETQEAYIYTDSGVFGNKVKVVPTGEADQNGNKIGVDENGHRYIIMSNSQLKASDVIYEGSPYAKKIKSDKNQKVAIRLDSKKGEELYSKFVTADTIASDRTLVSSVSMMRSILSGLYREICNAEKQIHNRDLEMRQRDGVRGTKFQYSQNLEKLVDKLTFAWNMNREEVLAKLKAEGDKIFKLTNESYNIQRNHDTQGMTPEQMRKYDESKTDEFLKEYHKVFGNFEPKELAKLYATGENNKLMDNINAKVDVKQLQNDVSKYIQGQESGREAIKEMPKYIAIGTVAGVAEGITGGGATPLVATMCAATLWNTAEELIKNDEEFDIKELAKKVAIDTALTYGPIKGFQALERGLGEMLVKKAVASGISREAAHALTMSKEPLTLLKSMVKSGEITDKVVAKLVTHSSEILAAETVAFDTAVGTTAEVVQTGEVTADGVIKYASISAVAQGMFLLARGIKGSPKETVEPPKPSIEDGGVIKPQTVLGKATGEGTHIAGGKIGEGNGKMPKAREEVARSGQERDVAVRRQTQDLPVRKQSRELEHIWDDNAGVVTIGKEHFDVYAETDLAKLRQLKKKVDNWSDTSRPKAELDSEKLLIQQKIDERIKFLEEHPEAQNVRVKSETVRQINEGTDHTVDRILSKDKRQVITEEESRVISEKIANENDPAKLQTLRNELDGRFGITDNNHVSTVDKLRKQIDAKIKKLNEQANMLKATVDEIRAAKEGKTSFDGGDKVAKLLQDKVESVRLSDAQKAQLVAELEQSGLKVKANTKKAVKEFKKAQAEKVKAQAEQPKVEEQNTTQQKHKTAMDILSDFEHPIKGEDVQVVAKEIDAIMENNSLTPSQKRGYLQSMLDGLESRPDVASVHVKMLKNYLSEQMNKLKLKATVKPATETLTKPRTAMDILSDFEHPITNKEAKVVTKEINNIVSNNSLSNSQKRGYLQSMYDGLANRRPQSLEVVKLRAYIGEKMKALKTTTSKPKPVVQKPVRENSSTTNESNIGFGRRNPNRTRYEEIKSEFEKAPKDVDVERVGNYAKNSSSEDQISFLRKKLVELKGKEGVNNAKVSEAIRKADAQLKNLKKNRTDARQSVRANKPAAESDVEIISVEPPKAQPDVEIIGVEPPKNDGIVDLANPAQRDGFVEQMRRQQQSIDDVNNQIAIDNANYFIDEFGQINWGHEPHNDFGF